MLNVQAIYIFSVYVAIVEVFVFVILREMSLNSVVWGWLIYFFSSLAVLNLLVDFQAHLIISLRSALLVMFIQCDFFHPAFRFSPKVKHRRPAAIFSGGFVKARRAKCPPPGVLHTLCFSRWVRLTTTLRSPCVCFILTAWCQAYDTRPFSIRTKTLHSSGWPGFRRRAFDKKSKTDRLNPMETEACFRRENWNLTVNNEYMLSAAVIPGMCGVYCLY